MAPNRTADKFPLWLHPTGQWAKKIRGRTIYFGVDKDKALAEYVRTREDLEAGRRPRPAPESLVTIADISNRFLAYKDERVRTGELSPRTWSEYHLACERLVAHFGRGRAVADLRPDDFGELRYKLARIMGPASLTRFITLAKSLFLFAYKAELIEVPVRYGTHFDKPPKRVMRIRRHAKAPKLIIAKDARKLIAMASPQLRAMILLGLNCGYGQTDCANLQRSALRKPGWIDAARLKTGTPRRAPLWPETIQALKEVHRIRPEAADPADADCVFLTEKGNRWCRYHSQGEGKRGLNLDAVAQAFRKLAKAAGVKVPGGPYVLRHVFRTIADEIRDQPAIMLIMGHTDASISDHYRESISDERLKAVTDHVHEWLFPPKKPRK